MEIKVLYKQGKNLKLMAIYNCSISVIKFRKSTEL